MIYSIKDVFHPYSLKDNCLISVNGDITFGFQLDVPEIFTLSEKNMDDIHSELYKFVKTLPNHTIVHKQDVYLMRNYNADNLPDNTFLEKATKTYFKDRKYLENHTYLFLTLGKIESLQKTVSNVFYLRNSYKYEADTQKVMQFSKDVNSAISTLNTCQYIKANPIKEDDFKNIIFLYYNGWDSNKLNDIEFKPEFKIGKNYYSVLALIEEVKQGEYVYNCKRDQTLSTDKYEFFKFFTQSFGLEINCNHIVNQILFVDDHLKNKEFLESKSSLFKTFSSFSSFNKETDKKFEDHLKEIEKDEKQRLCRCHFNVMFFSEDKQELSNAQDDIVSKYRDLGAYPYTGSFDDFQRFFLGCVPGATGYIQNDNTFYTDIQKALCYFYFISNYKSDKSGIVFNDRLNNLPVIKDIWDEPYRTKQITARNFAIIADTGSGKSFLLNHLYRHFIEQDYSLVLGDIGDSYEVLAKVYKDKLSYIKYVEGKSLGINPFKIQSLEDLEKQKGDKIRKLSDFVFIHYKKATPATDNERVSMNMIIRDFYNNCSDKHNFPSFYNYVKGNRKTLLNKLEIKPEFFNIDEFIHICSEYVSGIYDFLYADTDELDQLQDKQGAIFELSDVLKNPTLLPIMFLSIQDAVDTKIWLNNDSNKKVLVYEETAKLITFPEMFTAISYAAQTVRKYDGGLGIVLQTIDNMPLNEVGIAILNNTHTYYIFEPKKGVKSLKERLNLSDHDINQLLSIRSNTGTERPYTEFTLVLGSKTNCYRLEVPKEAYYTFLSEKSDKKRIFAELNNCGNIEEAIMNLIKNENVIQKPLQNEKA